MSGPPSLQRFPVFTELKERMFGASQFMFTGGRARLRPPDIAGALFRPTRRHARCYDRARRRPFAALSWANSWPSSRGCPSFSNLGPSRLSARDTWRPRFRGPCCKSRWGAPSCGRQLYLLAPLDAPRGADGLARVKFLLAHLSDPHVGPLPRPRRRELIGKPVTGYSHGRAPARASMTWRCSSKSSRT